MYSLIYNYLLHYNYCPVENNMVGFEDTTSHKPFKKYPAREVL